MVQELNKRPGVTEDRDTTPLPTLQLPPLTSAQQCEVSEHVASAQTTKQLHMDQSEQDEDQMDEGEIVPSQHRSHESRPQSSGQRRTQARQEALLKTPAVNHPMKKRQNVRTLAKQPGVVPEV
jgi:hypothetical protein